MIEVAHHKAELFGRFGLFVHDPVDDDGVDASRKVALEVMYLARVQGIGSCAG